ncbi:uncharacterized protein LOC113238161 [Hyposmocoma kahamanoa]|uniref:uncharacterized protein LOC113238161 n=1 Tax=Hyposmocoma kahamanoa TaxID=1477025 RepID=UPI000E6D8D7A|nr:uncharacterized protein LOC113238161 [Hyposmocoma kahamanoa]
MSHKNKVVLVTGGSSGIGAAIAVKFTEEGAKVAIVGRNETKLDSVAKTCERNGHKPLIIRADVSNDDDVKRIVSTTIQHFEKLDVLVNNAGFSKVTNILDKDIMAKYDEIMGTNLRGVVYLTHLAAPYLIESQGNIINISSITSTITSFVGTFVYSTSKAGLDHFTRCIALELAPKGVRVNAINPGFVRTDILENMGISSAESDKIFEMQKYSTPLGKIIEPEEIADLAAYLASDSAKSITGATHIIDNGTLLSRVLVAK